MSISLRGGATAVFMLGLLTGSAHAAPILFNGTYGQDFDSLASTGTGTATPAGWSFVETRASADGAYATGAGTDNQGNSYSFGAAGSGERAMGTLQSGSLLSTIFFQFTNTSATPLTSLDVSYFGEQWRLGERERFDRLDFAYSLDATTFTDGSYVDVNALDFSSPMVSGVEGPRDGNGAANRTALVATIGDLNIAQGQTVTFRWSDFNAAFGDDGLAVDDFTLTTAVPEPSAWAMMIVGFGAAGAMIRRRARLAA